MACPAAGGLRLAAKVVAHHIRGDVGPDFEMEWNELSRAGVNFWRALGAIAVRLVLRRWLVCAVVDYRLNAAESRERIRLHIFRFRVVVK